MFVGCLGDTSNDDGTEGDYVPPYQREFDCRDRYSNGPANSGVPFPVTMTVLTNTVTDSDNDGFSDSLSAYFYNSSGKLTKVEKDDGLNGTVDGLTTYTYSRTEYHYPNQLMDKTSHIKNVSVDSDNNGSADAIYKYFYDFNGNETRVKYDSDGNGTWDMSYTYLYNSASRKTITYYDDGADGAVGAQDTKYQYYHDSSGFLTHYYGDREIDGIINSATYLANDADGNPLVKSYDSDFSGTFDKIDTYTYDASGNALTYSVDSDANGFADRVTSYAYDADGNMLSENLDSDADGLTDSITTYNYIDIIVTPSEKVIEKNEYDTGNDGILNYIYSLTYYPDGRLKKATYSGEYDDAIYYKYDGSGNESSCSDSSSDGDADFLDEKTYDDYGNLIRHEEHTLSVGRMDHLYVYKYDKDGRLVSLNYKYFAPDGSTRQYKVTYYYSVNGHLSHSYYDEEKDGINDDVRYYTTDADGNILQTDSDHDIDGTIDSIVRKSYDANGNSLSAVLDFDGDGSDDEIILFTYNSDGTLSTKSWDYYADGSYVSIKTIYHAEIYVTN